MFLSFIIPIYNSDSYISSCLDMILHTSLGQGEYEVILVDDGSKDDSFCICEEYTQKYSNIYLYQQKNDGPATARNNGLEHAQGDYIWFVDADDSINPEILPRLKAVVEAEDYPDQISFGYISQFPDGDHSPTDVQKTYVCSGLEFL